MVESSSMKDRPDRHSTRPTKEPPEPEQQLVEQALEHGGDALGVLLQRWRPWLLARARRELGGEQPGGQRPSDLVQQTCVLALRFVATFQGRSRPELRGWLATILHHAILQVRRQSRADRRAELRTTQLSSELVSLKDSASRLLSARQRYREVVTALAHLPKRQRDALYLRLLEERSVTEIAAQLGVSEQSVASLLKRGLVELRERLCPPASKAKRTQAARVEAALLTYLRDCDRCQAPARDDFLRCHPECATDLAPLLDWLTEVRERLATTDRSEAAPAGSGRREC